MKLLSLLHRWTGGLIGFVLAILGLTGAILVWEEQWIALPQSNEAVVQQPAAMAEVIEAAGPDLARVTFAEPGMSLHHLVFRDGSGAYVAQDGNVVERWAGKGERPELWLFDLHHYLLAGDTGETVAGIAGIVGLLFVITGLILWWRSRRSFAFRLWPRAWKPGPIVSHHRDLGLVSAPLLLLSLVTGVAMIFAPLRTAILGEESRPRVTASERVAADPAAALAFAAERFPDAALRRLSMPKKPGDPITVRLRQPFEWTPNGRTQVGIEADGKAWIEDAGTANRAAALSEKAYPLHSARVGGVAYKLLMTLSGLALTMLGGFTTWSFWSRRAAKRHRRSEGARRLSLRPIEQTVNSWWSNRSRESRQP